MRRNLLFVLIGAALVAAAWSAGWYWIAAEIRTRVDGWAEARRAEGLTARYGAFAVTGFPYAWRVMLSDAEMAGAGPTRWQWKGAAVEARMAPWRMREIALRFPGDHTVTAGDGDVEESVTLNAVRPDATVELADDGRLARLVIDWGDASVWRRGEAGPMRAERLFATVQPHRAAGADHQTDTFDLTVQLDNAALPRAPAPIDVLGPQIAGIGIDLAFKGPLRGGNLEEAVRNWRDDGGTIEVNRAAMRWGPVDASGDGTLALDEQNRPLGAFTLRWRGYGAALDALSKAGKIDPREAAFARIALSMLARQTPGGQDEAVAPLTAQDGRLFVAGIPIRRLDPLTFR